MHVLIVEANIKPGMRDRFLDAILDDAAHSEADEPGCLRFNVLQDAANADRFYFYEVYTDQAAVDAHRLTPHFQRFAEVLPELVVGDLIRRVASTVHPADAAWR